MEDFFADLYDDDKREDGEEPSFSLYEFKKWLSRQNKQDKKPSESIEEDKKNDLKAKFKERFKEKVRKRRKKD